MLPNRTNLEQIRNTTEDNLNLVETYKQVKNLSYIFTMLFYYILKQTKKNDQLYQMVFNQSNDLKQVRNNTEENLKLVETLQAGKKHFYEFTMLFLLNLEKKNNGF